MCEIEFLFLITRYWRRPHIVYNGYPSVVIAQGRAT